MEEKGKSMAVTVMAILTLVVIVVGATYAYFQAQTGEGATTPITVTTATNDNLYYTVSDPISITATQQNFATTSGNLSDDATASANLIASNSTTTANYTYNVYLDIAANTFEYTDGSTAELLLQVYAPGADGTEEEVTELTGLEYTTVTTSKGSVSGFDITGYTKLIAIAEDHAITSNGTLVTQNWRIVLTFVNLDSDQQGNVGNTLNATLKIQTDKIHKTYLADTIIAQYTADGDNGLYYHDGKGTYATLEAEDNSYRYVGADPKNYVCFGSTETTCPTENLYRIIGVFGDQVKLIKADIANDTHLGTSPADQSHLEYPTSNWTTYKGSQSTVPLYYWSGSSSNQANTWSSSTLNTSALNNTYLNYLGTIWTNKIATTTWKVGGNTYANVVEQNAKAAYTNEIVSPVESTTYDAKIGLMYVSDYMYAADPTYWTKVGYNSGDATTDYRAALTSNWMSLGANEWTISRSSDNADFAFAVYDTGYVNNYTVYSSYGVRPVFYLTSGVEYSGDGDGTASNPYRIAL